MKYHLSLSPARIIVCSSSAKPLKNDWIVQSFLERCKWWDLVCKGFRGVCRATAGISDILLNQVDGACTGDEFNELGQEPIDSGNELLVERGIFTQEFVNSIDVIFCGALSDFNAYGLTVSEDRIWLDDYWITASRAEVAILLAHEYTHIRQWRRYDDSYLKCEYAEDVVSGTGTTGNDNWIEAEAYDFADSVTSCILHNTACP